MLNKTCATVIKQCKIHGVTEFAVRTGECNRQRCRKCAGEAVVRRRNKLKKLSIEYKGGKCEKCGYNKCSRSLDFHHLDPSQKDFGIAYKGHTRSWENTRKELDKCILLCKNCHGEEHERLALEE